MSHNINDREKEEIKELKDIERVENKIRLDLLKQEIILKEIRDDFRAFAIYILRYLNLIPVSMELVFQLNGTHAITSIEGDKNMASVAFTLTPLTVMLGTPVEKNADESIFVFDPTKIVWSVQDPNVVSFVQNSDGTATFTPMAVGETQVGCADTATGLSAVATAAVTQGGAGGGPVTMELVFTPVVR